MDNQKIKQLISDFISLEYKFYIKSNFDFSTVLQKISDNDQMSEPFREFHPSDIIKVLLKIVIEQQTPIRVIDLKFNEISEKENEILNTDPIEPEKIVENSYLFKNGEFRFTINPKNLSLLSSNEIYIFKKYIDNQLLLPISSLTTGTKLKKIMDYIHVAFEVPRNMCVFYLLDNTLQFGVILSDQRVCDNSQVLIKNISPHWVNNYKFNEDITSRIDAQDVYIENLNIHVANSYNAFSDVVFNKSPMSNEAILDDQWYKTAQSALSWAMAKCGRLRNFDKVMESFDLYKILHNKTLILEYFFNVDSRLKLVPSSSKKYNTLILDSCFYCITRPKLTDIELVDYGRTGRTIPVLIIPIYMLSLQYNNLIKNSLPENLQELYGEW